MKNTTNKFKTFKSTCSVKNKIQLNSNKFINLMEKIDNELHLNYIRQYTKSKLLKYKYNSKKNLFLKIKKLKIAYNS